MTPRDAESMVRRPPGDQAYRGLSYAAAANTAEELVCAAARTGYWRHLPEHLTALREVMGMQAIPA